jgi:hypothetical protein
MRSIVLSIALAASALALSFVGASAQRVGVEVYAGPGYSGYNDGPYYYSPRYERRAYRYYSDSDDVDVKVRRSGGCGTYFYWDGETCVDARRRRSSY